MPSITSHRDMAAAHLYSEVCSAPSAPQRTRQHHRRMHGLATAPVRDLAPAAGAVSNQKGVLGRGADRGKQIQLRHLHRQLVVLGLVAEGAGHAAATGLDDVGLEPGNPVKHARGGIEGAESLLMAVSVDEGGVCVGLPQAETGPNSFFVAQEQFFQQEGALRDLL